MQECPLVSIVVPIYNHEKYVGTTLRSLIAQAYANLELIVIDDGSSDNSLDEVNKLAADCRQRFRRYVQLEQPNRGASVASNRGIDIARGDFIFSFASDDVAEPETISALVPAMLGDPSIGLACGDADFIDASGAPIQMQSKSGKRHSSFMRYATEPKAGFDLVTDFGMYRSFIDYNYIPIGILLRRSYFSQIGCFDPTFALEDWAAWLSLSKICRFKFIDRILCHYRFHGTNTVVKSYMRLQSDLVRLMLREAEYCHLHGLEGQWRSFTEQSFETYRRARDAEVDHLRNLLNAAQERAARAETDATGAQGLARSAEARVAERGE